ncbi:hypothetical protein EDD18DRAFT_1357748 [Armillaria luteobubalina]|uniref:Uncharacterized protein n=1 Tax=Armillaria luteobubalina TaxID=153913 RepID=A0AA39UJY0_9AGAR|nr:hypothetical protein EDD18DRAFT_1357748 [Armillaria luteobubalina]
MDGHKIYHLLASSRDISNTLPLPSLLSLSSLILKYTTLIFKEVPQLSVWYLPSPTFLVYDSFHGFLSQSAPTLFSGICSVTVLDQAIEPIAIHELLAFTTSIFLLEISNVHSLLHHLYTLCHFSGMAGTTCPLLPMLSWSKVLLANTLCLWACNATNTMSGLKLMDRAPSALHHLEFCKVYLGVCPSSACGQSFSPTLVYLTGGACPSISVTI